MNPQVEQPASTEEQNKLMLVSAIQWLKKKALAGKDPELQVDFIIDNFDDPTSRALAATMLNQPFDEIGKLDPEIMQEPLRSWFQRVYDLLREAVKNADTTIDAGKSGIIPDSAGDETPDN